MVLSFKEALRSVHQIDLKEEADEFYILFKRTKTLEELLKKTYDLDSVSIAQYMEKTLKQLDLFVHIKTSIYRIHATITDDEVDIDVLKLFNNTSRYNRISRSLHSELLNQIQQDLKNYILELPQYRLLFVTGSFDFDLKHIEKR